MFIRITYAKYEIFQRSSIKLLNSQSLIKNLELLNQNYYAYLLVSDMASSVEDYVRRADKAEKEIESLLSELKNLEVCSNGNAEESAVPEELEKLQIENKKLKYRLGVLQRAVSTEMSSSNKRPKLDLYEPSTMPSIAQLLIDVFRSAVRAAFPDLGSDVPCPVTLSSTQADYQFNGAMAISGILKVFIITIYLLFCMRFNFQIALHEY